MVMGGYDDPAMAYRGSAPHPAVGPTYGWPATAPQHPAAHPGPHWHPMAAAAAFPPQPALPPEKAGKKRGGKAASSRGRGRKTTAQKSPKRRNPLPAQAEVPVGGPAATAASSSGEKQPRQRAARKAKAGRGAGKAKKTPYVPDPRLTKKGTWRTRNPVTDLTVDIPEYCRGDGELGWSQEILDFSTVELNQWLKSSDLSLEQAERLKALRRRIKNRRYTQKAREAEGSAGGPAPSGNGA